jgi:hypothetical protein
MKPIGPSIKTTYHCFGCSYLKLETWKFYGENDDVDSGTDARCMKEDRDISSYYSAGDLVPDWCPFLSAEKNRLTSED